MLSALPTSITRDSRHDTRFIKRRHGCLLKGPPRRDNQHLLIHISNTSALYPLTGRPYTSALAYIKLSIATDELFIYTFTSTLIYVDRAISVEGATLMLPPQGPDQRSA